MKTIIVLIMLIAVPSISLACTVSHIIDGDTFVCDYQKIRIAGIDAPEITQPEGQGAKAALSGVLAHRDVVLAPVAVDKYGRTVAHVYAGGINVGEYMLKQRQAKLYLFRQSDARTIPLKNTAQDVDFEDPYTYRTRAKLLKPQMFIIPSITSIKVKQTYRRPDTTKYYIIEREIINE